MGGYVWDWADQGLRQQVPEAFKQNIGIGPVKETFFAYGGWWNKDGYTDANFCMNGLVSADRKAHPGLGAIKHVYSYLHVVPVDLDRGQFKLKSWFDFVNVNEMLEGKWSLLRNGNPVAKGIISDLDIQARGEKLIELELPDMPATPGSEYALSFEFSAKDSYSPLVNQGSVLAQWQFLLSSYPASTKIVKAKAPKIKEDAVSIIVDTDNGSFYFDRRRGILLSWKNDAGTELLSGGFQPDFWRAITDNDRGGYWNRGAPIREMSHFNWQNAGKNWKVDKRSVTEIKNKNAVQIEFAGSLPDVESKTAIKYTIFGNGELRVKMIYAPNNPKAVKNFNAPLRYGMRAVMPQQFENVEYYGRGPEETYAGRRFEPLGVYKNTVDGLWHDYPRPQENGARSDVRWVSFTNNSGSGILVIGEPALMFGAKFYDRETISNSEYSFQMKRSDHIFLNLDFDQMGVGGTNSWGRIPDHAYRLKNRPTKYAIRMLPITANQDREHWLRTSPLE